MSVPSYSFHSLPLKLPNKGIDLPFPLLKLSNKGRKEYYKIILFIPFRYILFPPPKWDLKLPNKGMYFLFPLLKLPNKEIEEYSKFFFFIFFSIPFHSLFLNEGLKPQIFILPKLGGMRGNEIKFNEFFTKSFKIPPYIQPFIYFLKNV